MRLLLLLALLAPATAHAEKWIVFPIRAENPPSRDPTLLRMSVDLVKVISEHVPGEVRLVKREERDESCPLQCPSEIASILSVDHVIAMYLKETQDQLAVVLHEPAREPAIRKIPCTYSDGVVSCDELKLAEVIDSWRHDAPFDAKAVQAAFRDIAEELERCGPQEKGAKASVRFRVRPDGRVTDVRIDPPGLQDRKPYDCMARIVESLRVPPFSAPKPIAFRMPLPRAK